ncbi:MAG TPA: DUF4279 domain-containing protein [Chryseosolibacter sp.]
MQDVQIIQLVEAEFRSPALSVTRQYLDIHSAVYENGKLTVLRIDREDEANSFVTVYLPVQDEKFYFAAYIDLIQEEVARVVTEPHHDVYFRATSESYSINELRALTTLAPTDFWNKGDLKPRSKGSYGFSQFKLLPNPEPDAFEDKLEKLLNRLEEDKQGVKQLAQKADGYIQVYSNVHNDNGMIGGYHLDAWLIKRLSNLELAIDFNVRVSGKSLQ